MPTFDDVCRQVDSTVRGGLSHVESAGTLSADIPLIGPFELQVEEDNVVKPGLFEVDAEVVQVTSLVDGRTGKVPGWGRGLVGSVQAEHLSGVKVTRSPILPLSRVREVVNAEVTGSFPALFSTSLFSTDARTDTTLYELPAGTSDVLDSRFRLPGVETWEPVTGWMLDRNADTSIYTSGVVVDLSCFPPPGAEIKFTLQGRPQALASGDTPWSVSGLADTAVEAIVLLASARLLPVFESARLQQSTVEQSQRSDQVSHGAATNAAKYLYALGQEKLQAERERLLAQTPVRIVRTW